MAHAPWYVLDGTHPEAQAHLESVLRHDATEWGCTVLQARRELLGRDPRRTASTTTRDPDRGLPAGHGGGARGAGDAFILGCNHPLWPSLGLVHGSRSSNDIKRTWARVKGRRGRTFSATGRTAACGGTTPTPSS
jgi:alpha-galactosidase